MRLFFLLCLLLLGGCSTDNNTSSITIFYTNDSHGRIYDKVGGDVIVGIDYISALNDSTPNSLLVDVGDTFHGNIIPLFSRGEVIVKMMGVAGYDVMSLGNHDFIYGVEQLLRLDSIAIFDILTSNIRQDSLNSEVLLCQSVVKIVDGVRIGFVGLTTPLTNKLSGRESVRKLNFGDCVTSCRSAVESLKEQNVDVIVCLAHIGREEAVRVAREVGVGMNGRFIIIDGHDHINTCDTVGGVFITSSGKHYEALGMMTIKYDKSRDSVLKIDNKLLTPHQVHSEVLPNLKLRASCDSVLHIIDELMGSVVGCSEVTLSSAAGTPSTVGVRNAECPIGNLMSDAVRISCNTQLSIINGGGIRSDIMSGEILKRDLYSLSPFENYAIVKLITAVQLKQVMEKSISKAPSPFGGFLHISGFSFCYNPNMPVGSKIVSMKIAGNKVDMNDDTTKYSIAMSDFSSGGGDGYDLLKQLKTIRIGLDFIEILSDYIGQNSPLTTKNTGLDNRILMLK